MEFFQKTDNFFVDIRFGGKYTCAWSEENSFLRENFSKVPDFIRRNYNGYNKELYAQRQVY